ncbi:MAG: acyl-CoA thioesterase, partial [Bacteroidetes bacterium]|nr:acyl-CoA thioesterase [Bacteroidota bacterium]
METTNLVIEPFSFYGIRFNDCDPFSHLNNGRYIDYFINAREDHLAKNYAFDFREWIAKGFGWVVTGHEINYLKPANVYETVCIQTTVVDYGDTHLVVEAIMTDEKRQQVKAIMWSQFVFVNIATGKRDKHPEELMDWVRSLKNPAIDAGAGM